MASLKMKINKRQEEEEKTRDILEDLAPDGGWGWVVCVGTFFANFIADGTMFSSGVQMLAFLDYFGESKADTAWVSSSQLGLSMMMGPLVSYLIGKYSVRTVTIAGAVIAFIGAVAGAFSPNLPVLIFTYGVICGSGMCLFFLSSIVAVGLYFTEKRAVATGIAMSGSGVGVIVYPYLTESLMTIYDWRNTLLIIAGLCLNAAVCGALFRPLNMRSSKKSTCKCLEENSIPDSDENKSMISYHDYQKTDLLQEHKMYNSTSKIDKSYVQFQYLKDNNVDRQFHSDLFLNGIKHNNKSAENNTFLAPNLRSDVFYSGSIKVIPSYESQLDCINLAYEDSDLSSDQSSCDSSKNGILDCFRLLKKPSFLVLLACMVMWTSQGITMTYIPDMAVSKGIARYDAAMLISIIGVTNTVVRVLAGCIVDFFHVRSLHLYIGALCLGATANFALPWCNSFTLLAACAVGFGMCMGTVVCLRTILIADVLGMNQLTQAFGIIAFFQGLAFTVNPPFAGFVFDITGSYVYPFILVGCFYTLATGCSLLLLFTRRHSVPVDRAIDISIDDDERSPD